MGAKEVPRPPRKPMKQHYHKPGSGRKGQDERPAGSKCPVPTGAEARKSAPRPFRQSSFREERIEWSNAEPRAVCLLTRPSSAIYADRSRRSCWPVELIPECLVRTKPPG